MEGFPTDASGSPLPLPAPSPAPEPVDPGRGAFTLLFLCIFAWASFAPQKTPPRAEHGVLDLSAWDLKTNGPAPLNGQWAFLWDGRYDPENPETLFPGGRSDSFPLPSLWKGRTGLGTEVSPHGRAVYALTVRLGNNTEPMRLYISSVLSVCRVWADGRIIATNGEFADATRPETPRTHVLLPQFTPAGPEMRLALEVSNQTNTQGGVNSSILLGESEQILRMANTRWAIGVLIGGMLLAIGAYHLIMFASRRQDRTNLFFGLFCLAWSASTFFSPGNGMFLGRLLELPWRAQIDLALLPYGLTTPLLVIFYNSLFPKRFGRAVNIFYGTLGAGFMLHLLLSPPDAFGTVPMLYFLLTRTASLYLLAAFVTDILRRERGVLLLVPGYLALAYAELSWGLLNLHVISSAGFAPYGMPAFILAHSLFMSVRFSQTFLKVERLSGELETINEHLMHLNRLKDEFLANATHELKTPLAGMVGISDSLLAGAGGEMSEAAKGHLMMLSHSGKRLSRLVDDVLEHARLEHMDVELAPEVVSLNAAARRVLTLTRGLARDKGLDLREGIPADLPPVLADSGRLEQILFNLVGNAIKYTEHGWVELSAQVCGERLEISVADSGTGIAPADQEKIFESYSQLAASDSGGTGGAGLGLAIAKRLVELHGGELRVASAPGQGNVFTFSLPLCFAAKDPAQSVLREVPPLPVEDMTGGPPPQGAEGRDYQVLAMDDEPVNLHVVATCLAVAGISVKTARGGAEALRLLDEGDNPAVVLLDVMMPGLDGYAVCRELRRRRSGLELPVVMLTCRNRVEDVVEGFATGTNDYLTKPFAREELVARVSTQLRLAEAHRVLEENASLRREVTMRRKTEQDLRLRQLRLSRMLDAIGEAVFAVNESREIAFCNQAFETLTGRNAQELLGQPLAVVLAEPEAPAALRFQEEMDRMLDGGNVPDGLGITDIAAAGGTARSCRAHAARLELEDERLVLLSLGPAKANGGGDGHDAAGSMAESAAHAAPGGGQPAAAATHRRDPPGHGGERIPGRGSRRSERHRRPVGEHLRPVEQPGGGAGRPGARRAGDAGGARLLDQGHGPGQGRAGRAVRPVERLHGTRRLPAHPDPGQIPDPGDPAPAAALALRDGHGGVRARRLPGPRPPPRRTAARPGPNAAAGLRPRSAFPSRSVPAHPSRHASAPATRRRP